MARHSRVGGFFGGSVDAPAQAAASRKVEHEPTMMRAVACRSTGDYTVGPSGTS